MAYTIQISEQQRALITDLLGELVKLKEHDPNSQDWEEVEILHKMFQELPEAERETPGALHGFCL